MSERTFTIKLPNWSMAEFIGYTPITTFWEDFSVAEKGGIVAINKTFNVAFNEWKTNIKYIAELELVMGHKAEFFASYLRNNKLKEIYYDYYKHLNNSQIEEIYSSYIDKFYEIHDYVYGDNSPYSEEEISYFFRITD